jgi:hypothetical protein
MLRYYLIRERLSPDKLEDGRIVAIHKIRDSAQMCFVELCSREDFQGDVLQLVVVDVDDHGLVQSETLIYMYIRGSSIVVGIN